MKMRTRREVESNYSSIFINGKTIRIPLDRNKPITELRFPEFYDVAINSKCAGGCPYCYTSATTAGKNFPDVVNRINSYFGKMTENQRPFQVALGGAGEPTMHPDFVNVLKTFRELDIIPNYTTNGMHFTPKVIAATLKYSGGVAITCHPHLEAHWHKALKLAIKEGIKTNVHLVISTKDTIDKIGQLQDQYGTGIDYFVLLPHMNVGFASKNPQKIDYAYLEEYLDKRKLKNVAFGANFYEFLCKTKKWDVSLYPPEILSKYLIMDENMFLFKSSFDTSTPVHDYNK
jgi:MoaA/NifB/PqqE/SkfB family radical SAM enzyme